MKQLLIDFLAWLMAQLEMPGVDTDAIPEGLQSILTSEVNAINQALYDLDVAATVSLPDSIYSPQGNFVRYRIVGPGLKMSKVQSYAADVQSAINDNRRSIPGAPKVIVKWRDGLSFDVPYPFEPDPLLWEDVTAIGKLQPFQMLLGANFDAETPGVEVLDYGDESVAHVLVSGGSGSGKSVLLVNMLASLCYATPPDKLQVIILDTKHGRTLKPLQGLPHVTLCNEVEDCIAAVHAVQAELQRRKRTANDGAKVFLVLEELADLMTAASDPDALWQPLITLSSTAREFGLHMIACTQYANTEVINANFRTNFLTRLGGQFATDTEGRVATGRDDLKCSMLPGKGAFFLVHQLRVVRVQSCKLVGEALQQVVADIAQRWKGVQPYRIAMDATPEALPMQRVETEDERNAAMILEQYDIADLFDDNGKLRHGMQLKVIRLLFGKDAKNVGIERRKAKDTLEFVKTTKLQKLHALPPVASLHE